MFRLPIRPRFQRNSYECGLAVVKTVMESMGREVGTDILESKLKPDPVKGTHPTRILDFFRKEGFEYLEKNEASIEDLEELLGQRYYCLVVYQAWFWGKEEDCAKKELGHYSVVFGFDDDYLYMADPGVSRLIIGKMRIPLTVVDWIKSKLRIGWDGRRGIRKVAKKKFESYWVDEDWEGREFDRWLLAVRLKRE